MKKSILYLTMASTLLISSSFAKFTTVQYQNSDTVNTKIESNSDFKSDLMAVNIQKPAFNLESNTKAMETIAVLSSNYKKSIQDIAEENKMITECEEFKFQPLYIERTFEDQIKEYNQIIESPLTSESQQLNYDFINNSASPKLFEEFNNLNIGSSILKS